LTTAGAGGGPAGPLFHSAAGGRRPARGKGAAWGVAAAERAAGDADAVGEREKRKRACREERGGGGRERGRARILFDKILFGRLFVIYIYGVQPPFLSLSESAGST
jgi:hypothetical protein